MHTFSGGDRMGNGVSSVSHSVLYDVMIKYNAYFLNDLPSRNQVLVQVWNAHLANDANR